MTHTTVVVVCSVAAARSNRWPSWLLTVTPRCSRDAASNRASAVSNSPTSPTDSDPGRKGSCTMVAMVDERSARARVEEVENRSSSMGTWGEPEPNGR